MIASVVMTHDVRIALRKTALAVVSSSVLLGAVASQAAPDLDPSQNPPAQATSQTDTNRPAATTAAPDADTATDTSDTEVGSEKSNVDKDSSSGSYYPYSAGTVGDDPAEPTSTSVSTDTNDKASGPTNQWGDADIDGDGYLSQPELAKVAPSLSSSFDTMDVDSDEKLTRAEFRNWHESLKARLDADQDAN